MNFSYGNLDLGISGYGSFGQKVLNATAMMLNDPNRLPAYNVPEHVPEQRHHFGTKIFKLLD
ncbi:hypothetical protein [Flavobacterium sp. 3HN19-14]|uniref:hypothetical protein n=1 Tax=Flavobacterium sp. 3HN19-14 TaxID=3448133 RepID=UPI003EE42242